MLHLDCALMCVGSIGHLVNHKSVMSNGRHGQLASLTFKLISRFGASCQRDELHIFFLKFIQEFSFHSVLIKSRECVNL